MEIVLAGDFGKLKSVILKALVHEGHTVVAADLVIRDIPEIEGKYTAKTPHFQCALEMRRFSILILTIKRDGHGDSVTISSGTVTATGGGSSNVYGGAGIGGGGGDYFNVGGAVTISGGTVTATGGSNNG